MALLYSQELEKICFKVQRCCKGSAQKSKERFHSEVNPDEHWSAAFYAALNDQHFRDGENVLNLGRDDQAGFCLDTMTTHKLHGTLCVKDREPDTTRTDYANGTCQHSK